MKNKKSRYDVLIKEKQELERMINDQQEHLIYWISLVLDVEEVNKDHIQRVKERYEDYKQLQKKHSIKKKKENAQKDKKNRGNEGSYY